MKEIKLSQWGKNKGKYVALVDDEDFERLNQIKWFAQKVGKNFYAARKIRVDSKQKSVLMHCDIMGGKNIDHRDRNGLNNQRYNLRFCSSSENAMNMRRRENTTSAYKGVYFDKYAGKWKTQIEFNRKKTHIGLFVSEIDAAKAYNIKAIKLFGEFANLNIID